MFWQQIIDRAVSNTLFFTLLQVAAHAAHLAAASAPLAACAKERHVTPAAVSEESASSALCPCDGACVFACSCNDQECLSFALNVEINFPWSKPFI